ncbi:Oxidoreductase AflY [Lasiodiplodia hormozganensis]|uniref:Oxidoreductase AflY n=1 Tax=Lasiodiplodia hormozganensis TaxID=869390 RepID=A0AA40CY82_9PEZI|nr:Oxidoreductase AflY [Lasiodiplodia hormozganensis]
MPRSAIVELSARNAGFYHVPNIDEEATRKANELLQANHDRFHIFFNDRGFHNHTAHYLLSAYALGATAEELQRMNDSQVTMQVPRQPQVDRIPKDLSDPTTFIECMSKPEFFHDYVLFFEAEVDKKGVGPVVREYLLSDTPIAKEMLPRLYASFLHPLIHLGFGLEFDQPAITVEGLAQTAVHQNEVASVLLAAAEQSTTTPSRPMLDLIHEVHRSGIGQHPCWGNGATIPDSPLLAAPAELAAIAGAWQVDPDDELEAKTAEMVSVCAYFTAAAQRPPKKVKLDFFFMHNVNCSIFMSAMLALPWLRREEKARLLEWKGRCDIIAYANRGAPALDVKEIVGYVPKVPGGWMDIFRRVNDFDDDSHLTKLVRALAAGERFCKPYEGVDDARFPVRGDMYLKIAHMAVDAVPGETYFNRWVRGAGFPSQWEPFPNRGEE